MKIFQIILFCSLLIALQGNQGEAKEQKKTRRVPYSDKKNKCASFRCKGIHRDQILARDMCIHQCVHEQCYKDTYHEISLSDIVNRKEELILADKLRKDFLLCYEGEFIQKNYHELRSQCSQWSCKHIDKNDIIQREICIYLCVSPSCYYQIYDDLDSVKNWDILNQELEMERRKFLFKECVDAAIPKKKSQQKKPYNEIRAECVEKKCGDIYEENTLAKDVCIHKCIDVECYYEAYYELQGQDMSKLSNTQINKEKEQRKKLFIECYEQNTLKMAKYSSKRSYCSDNFCKEVEKFDKWARDLCLHKCVSETCFSDIYGKEEDWNQIFTDELEQMQIQEELKSKFIDCFQGAEQLEKKKYNDLLSKCMQSKCLEFKFNHEFQQIQSDEDTASFEDKFAKESCIHKCVSRACWDEIYIPIDFKKELKQENQDRFIRQKWRKHKMTQCIGKKEIQEKRKTYDELRNQCSMQTCNNIKKSDRLNRDLCLHKCINEKCFKIVYKDLVPHENLAQREIQVKNFRHSFVKCVEEDSGTKKYYPNIRAYCAKNFCILTKAEGDKLKTEMCIHKCVNSVCYQKVYKPLIIENSDSYVPQEFTSEKEKELFIDQYKWQFVQCYQELQQKQSSSFLHGEGNTEDEVITNILTEEQIKNQDQITQIKDQNEENIPQTQDELTEPETHEDSNLSEDTSEKSEETEYNIKDDL